MELMVVEVLALPDISADYKSSFSDLRMGNLDGRQLKFIHFK